MMNLYLCIGIGIMILDLVLITIMSVIRHFRKKKINAVLKKDYGDPGKYNIR